MSRGDFLAVLHLMVEYVTYLQKNMKAQGEKDEARARGMSGNNGMVIRKDECLFPKC
jgi:hypothetical protein